MIIPEAMKQYVIDELRLEDYEKIKSYFDENFEPSNVNGLYWIYLDQNNLTEIQTSHEDCQPFYVAVDLEEDKISCELLVRTGSRIRCDCICYATEAQRDWLIRLIDTILEKLEVHV